MKLLIVAAAALATAGCGCGPDSEKGCGVAGAGFDAKSVREEVENYRQSYLDLVQVRVSSNDCWGWKEGESASGVPQFESALHQLPVSVTLEANAEPRALGHTGLRAALIYEQDELGDFQTIYLATDSKLAREERLPRAFRNPVHIGLASVDGREVVVVATRSRATTAKRLFAMYSPTGELLYRDVHPSSALLDVKIEGDSVVLLGCGQSTHIRFRYDA